MIYTKDSMGGYDSAKLFLRDSTHNQCHAHGGGEKGLKSYLRCIERLRTRLENQKAGLILASYSIEPVSCSTLV